MLSHYWEKEKIINEKWQQMVFGHLEHNMLLPAYFQIAKIFQNYENCYNSFWAMKGECT